MPAERRSFHDPLEPLIYENVSFSLAALEEDEHFHAECQSFVLRMVAAGMVPVISDFVENELAFHLLKAALTTAGRASGQHWLDVKRDRPGVLVAAMSQVGTRRAELESMALKLPIEETVPDRAFQLMRDWALLPTDAYHLAVALESGGNAIASLDEDFLRGDGIIVYTCL